MKPLTKIRNRTTGEVGVFLGINHPPPGSPKKIRIARVKIPGSGEWRWWRMSQVERVATDRGGRDGAN